MILIISQNVNEESTNQIIDWLDHLKRPFIRINGADFEWKSDFSLAIENTSESLSLRRKERVTKIDDSINIVWYRRWTDTDFFKTPDLHGDSHLDHATSVHLFNEFMVLGKTVTSMLQKAKWISHPKYARNLNKLEVLKVAKRCGLRIPDTLITNSKSDLIKFKSKYHSIITKSISNLEPLIFKNEMYAQYTSEVDDSILEEIPERFFPSLFQENIEKMYELRIFYLDGQFYTMCMFSQQNSQTKTDFRKYLFSRPVRQVPYNLPLKIQAKVRVLMKQLSLETGSIDFIRSTDGEYVFLEVNATGQFGMVSYPCNYNIEKEFAKYLIKHDKKKASKK